MNGMIDIHNHVVFKFDDGPRTLDEALDMLRVAHGQGISAVFATSHFAENISEDVENEYFNKLEQLRQAAAQKDIPVALYSGAELFFHHYLEQTIKTHRVCTLAGLQQYALIEFPLFLMPSGVEEVLFNLSLSNIIPIIAHPERYSAVQEKPEKAIGFLRHGGLLQVNAGSILGDFGKQVQKLAMWMLENRMVHFIGSDAHAPEGRAFKLQQAVDYLRNHLDEEYIRQLVQENPLKIVNEVPIREVHIPEEEERPSFFQRLKRRLRG